MASPTPLGAVLLLSLAACAHGVGPARPAADVVWPRPPGAARVRLVAVFPPPGSERPAPSFLRRAWELISGVEPRAGSELLVHPFGVAAGPGDRFYVADPEGPAVLQVDPEGSKPIRCEGAPWAAPMGLAQGPEGSLLVADAGLPGLVRVSPDGTCTSLAPGAFERPIGVAFTKGRIYVVDAARHELVILDADGRTLERRGGRGSGPGQLLFPVDVAVLSSGATLVTDSLNAGVARWEADGRWVGRTAGAEATPFARPKGIASGPDDRVYVADGERDEVVVFDATGAPEYAIGATGSAPGQFTQPAGVSVSATRLLVADSLNGRVQVFEILGGRP